MQAVANEAREVAQFVGKGARLQLQVHQFQSRTCRRQQW